MTNKFTLISRNESETDSFGLSFAECIDAGVVIALNGELGSGKTRFVRSLCAGLGIDTLQVTSPTFVILQLYTDGRVPVAHFDTYRLADPDEFLAIGADEYVDSPDWLCLIEWADRVIDVLPADRLEINLFQTAETCREFTLAATGVRSLEVLEKLQRCEGLRNGR